uniref:CxC2-like cysteine cluster KDZ transposase-associated domain-containing protein n=1 Tax=Mycena chlorophos TaxID=658473 RepID=A0ABQ0M5I8_MYCCL|nr:predicted protein [Mycena chlorophos]
MDPTPRRARTRTNNNRRPDVDTGVYESHRGKRVVPTYGIYLSEDGRSRRISESEVAIAPPPQAPRDLRDPYSRWRPTVNNSGAAPEQAEGEEAEEAEDEGQPRAGAKRKYQSTVNPNAQWRPLKSLFLDELLRHEALGDWTNNTACASCQAEFEPTNPATRLFRCCDCGQFLRCLGCTIGAHKMMPLHALEVRILDNVVAPFSLQLQEWNGSFWLPAMLADLGLVYQLGHGGFPCPSPETSLRAMTVLDAPFIHKVNIRYCACPHSHGIRNIQQLLRNQWYPATVLDPATCATFKTLRAFRLFNVVGNLNNTDFVRSMERMTNTFATAGGLGKVPERTRQMYRMTRQWAFLAHLKRSGRGHDPAGPEETPLGGCAVLCWACPQDGRNIPENWHDVEPEYRFLYMVILAMDANFRMKNRLRSNEINDPSLGGGLAYWVDPRPYQDHVKNSRQMTTCIAFAALLQKNTRMTTGLRVSGVGGCVCARHECLRPNAMGDLQKGERYCNMDWILFSAIMTLAATFITISYDIACQWKLRLAERMERLPTHMQKDRQTTKMQFGLPVWHAPSHLNECQEENDLSLKPGVGKTDGEAIERFWSGLNPAAYSTKEMGLGHRADALDDRIDNHNFLKNVGLGKCLLRRLVVARDEYARQHAAFQVVSEGVSDELQEEWTAQVRAWEADNTKPNPYLRQTEECLSEAQIRLQLQEEEKRWNADGHAGLAGGSATSFIAAGIQIEDAQQRIVDHIAAPSLLTANHELKTEELRSSLLRKIERFRELQAIYIPGAPHVIEELEGSRDSDEPPPPPERTRLFMPSQMAWNDALGGPAGCLPGLAVIEQRQRIAQCENTLSQLRSSLHARRWLIAHRNANLTGQQQTTRAAKLIERMGERTNSLKTRYIRGFDALVGLRAGNANPHLRPLTDQDIKLDQDRDTADLDAREKLAKINTSRGARPSRNIPSKSRRIMSWIWTAPGAFDDDEAHLHDSLRIEWTRAMARRDRWFEEVLLLEEEMRRVLRYLQWQSDWWTTQAGRREVTDPALTAGLRAYALQSSTHSLRLMGYFKSKWTQESAASVVQSSQNVDKDD